MITIRLATPPDLPEILSVHRDAFGVEEGPEIAHLVADLLADSTAEPRLSLVAETAGRIVGHILFTAAHLQPGGQHIPAQILAPLAVAKEHQGQGVGGLLIHEGVDQLTASGIELVFVLGHPDYYPKFGFRPAGVLGYAAPYAIPIENANAWMVKELKAGIIGSVQGLIQCAATLDQPQHWRE
jgi:predicted N-acetyltransferase YhbS